jgi:glycosyltransferase involved in cell wall biosynthesis
VNPTLDHRSFYRDAGFIFIAKLLNRATLVFFRGWFTEFEEKVHKSKLTSFLFKVSYAKADKYIVLSKSFKAKLIKMGVPESTPFFIETTVANSDYVNELDLHDKLASFKEKMVILFLSRVEKEKGFYIALDAYKNFVIKFPERASSFIIAGDGSDLPAVKKYVAQSNIPNVIFLGEVRGDRKKEVLLGSHIMILPSITGDGLPNSILEGMLYGMPIISRATAGIPDIVEQGINGLLTESLDPLVFSEFISKLAFDIPLYKKMAETNHQKALENFTTQKVRQRMLGIYHTFEG